MNNIFVQQKKGAAMMIFVMIFLFASIALTYTLTYSLTSNILANRLFFDSKQSYLTAESGIEDMAYRFIAPLSHGTTETITLHGSSATTTATFDTTDDAYYVVSEARDTHAHRSAQLTLYVGSGASFNFGVQAGNGGFELTNGSSVTGNVFANGTVVKTGGGIATIYGDVISAGATGLIDSVNATGSAWAHTIRDSNIGGNVYAYTLDDGVVGGGAEYFTKINGAIVNGLPEVSGVIVGDEDVADMPITDEDVAAIEDDIVAYGTVIASTSAQCASGTYIVNSSISLGLVKIECNFEFRKQGAGTTLTLTGPIWVTGNITFKSGPRVAIASSVGSKTVPFIADNPTNQATSSKILVENGTTFIGTGSPTSYVLLLSQNNDSETGGAHNIDALKLEQSSAGDLLVYAAHGRITLANSIALNEVSGYKIVLGNSANITYESGLVNLLFSSGPGGGYTLGPWLEIP